MKSDNDKFDNEKFDKLMGRLVNVNSTNPVPIVTFTLNNKEIGRIVIHNDELKFMGRADVSAKIFIQQFIKPSVDMYIREKLGSKN